MIMITLDQSSWSMFIVSVTLQSVRYDRLIPIINGLGILINKNITDHVAETLSHDHDDVQSYKL